MLFNTAKKHLKDHIGPFNFLDISLYTSGVETVLAHIQEGNIKLKFKDILPQNKMFFKYFLVLCLTVNLLKHNIYAFFGRLRQYFACFDCTIFLCVILLSCGIARLVFQAETGVTASTRRN